MAKCPVAILRFFEDESSLFWLKFVEAQLTVSNDYVLQTESTEIASFEVAVKIIKLRKLVANREQTQHIPAEAEELLNELLPTVVLFVARDS